MSTLSKSHTVFGYVRSHYHRSIPEAITRMCLKYFDEDTIFNFKGNKLKKFLAKKQNELYSSKIKFNQDLSFLVFIIPNRTLCDAEENVSGLVSMGLNPRCSKDIDYIIISWTLKLFENDASDYKHNINRCIKYPVDGFCLHSVAALSQFTNSKQLSLKFNINSLQIKYKTDKIVYYPSLSTIQLNEISRLKWNVSTSLINNFKSYPLLAVDFVVAMKPLVL